MFFLDYRFYQSMIANIPKRGLLAESGVINRWGKNIIFKIFNHLFMSFNWKQFTRRIPIKAPAKSIYEAWSTQQGLESWFLRIAQFTKPDGSQRPRNSAVEKADRYKWLWHGYDDSVTEEKEILAANGWDQLQFRFSGDCIVTVTIKQLDGETICELVQDMPQEEEADQQHFFVECGNGWAFYLTNLKSVLEGGLDLRNKNHKLQNMISA